MSVEEKKFPDIVIDCKEREIYESEQYKASITKLLKKVVPIEVLEKESLKSYFAEQVPVIKWVGLDHAPTDISVTLLCRHQVHVKNYFYDMISRWLIPQNRLNIDLFFVADFQLPEIEGGQTFSIAEAVLHIKNEEDVLEIKKNIRTIETELRLGVLSDYHANRILEFKGLSSDRKTAMIQEKIGSLIRTRSKDFGQGIFSDMQYFLVTCKEEFKVSRDYHHISRIISVLYFIKKLLKQRISSSPMQRHLLVKFLKTHIGNQEEKKSVMGMIVGLNFLKENEVCGKNHLLKAVQHFIPDVKAIDDSFFIDRKLKDSMQLLYLEVEKEDGSDFSNAEINKLRNLLPDYLKEHIEQLIHPIFMPRNEEEVVRNIMTLSHQIKYVHDIPQVIISFDKQAASEISFTVIFVRVLKQHDESLKEIFASKLSRFKFAVERVRKAGLLRRKHIKEANVFRVFVPIHNYLRADHTVDLNKARKDTLEEIEKFLGEVRDYNGGMIYKQNQVYQDLKRSLGKIGIQNELLLEKFFYSITPAEMTVVQNITSLEALFLLFLQSLQKTQHKSLKKDVIIKQEIDKVFLLFAFEDISLKKRLIDKMEKLPIDLDEQVMSFYHHTLEMSYLGYVYFSTDENLQKQFISLTQKFA